MRFLGAFLACLLFYISSLPEPVRGQESEGWSLAKFDIDVTPPVGFQMAYDPVRRIDELGLRCRGIVLLGPVEPIVLCAVDWIGIANGGHQLFRESLAEAAGTSPSRVAVHTLHQHDAPRCDFSAEQLLNHAGVADLGAYSGSFAREVLGRLKVAVSNSLTESQPITHCGFGVGVVEEVASNRRILGADGTVEITRYTTCRDPKIRALPEGTIDPELSCLVFFNDEQPVVSLSYYACHPQSYYRTGVPSPDFPGIARILRSQDLPDTLLVHFNGAGGNIGAGKYNDGAKENRVILANRIAEGMKKAFENAKVNRMPLQPDSIDWRVTEVLLEPAPHIKREELEAKLANWKLEYWGAPDELVWLNRFRAKDGIELSCLVIGDIRVLHMPGELFVEYQLAAKKIRPDLQIAMAAYGDYGPGYIGTEVAYSEGGYETSPRASKVASSSERILMDGMKRLLEDKN